MHIKGNLTQGITAAEPSRPAPIRSRDLNHAYFSDKFQQRQQAYLQAAVVKTTGSAASEASVPVQSGIAARIQAYKASVAKDQGAPQASSVEKRQAPGIAARTQAYQASLAQDAAKGRTGDR